MRLIDRPEALPGPNSDGIEAGVPVVDAWLELTDRRFETVMPIRQARFQSRSLETGDSGTPNWIMHELYATQAILDKALAKAADQKAARITNLYLVVGEISTYADDSVQFYWDEISKGTIAAEAKLHFRHVLAEMQCMACFTKYHPQEGEVRCPNCGGTGAKILAGEEFFLEALDIE